LKRENRNGVYFKYLFESLNRFNKKTYHKSQWEEYHEKLNKETLLIPSLALTEIYMNKSAKFTKGGKYTPVFDLFHYLGDKPLLFYSLADYYYKKDGIKKLYVYRKDDVIEFADIVLFGIGIYKIPILNIISYNRIGDMYTETNITGGGGREVSVTGALVGGVIAGSAGAAIGGRKKIRDIKSTTTVVDKRSTILEIDYKGKSEFLKFDSNAYDAFFNLIPEKEFNLVKSKVPINQIDKNDYINDSNEIFEKIKYMAQLHKDGILTDDEFSKKKAELLLRI
jgi:hypothetical protein